MSARKCVSLNLSLTGCFGPNANTCCTQFGNLTSSRALTEPSPCFPRGRSYLSDSFISFFWWVSLTVAVCLCPLRLKYLIAEGQNFSSTPLCTAPLALSSLTSTFFSSVLALFISVLRSFVWKLCTAWFDNTPFSGTLNLKKSGIMSFSRQTLKNLTRWWQLINLTYMDA